MCKMGGIKILTCQFKIRFVYIFRSVTNGNNASWVCERCTLVNEPHLRNCAACQFAYHPKSNNPSNLPLFPVRQCSETMDALRLVEESEAREQMDNILAHCREVKKSPIIVRDNTHLW